MKERTFYYSDPLNDDFAGTDISTVKLPADYRYFPKTAIRRGFAGGLNFAVSPLIMLLQQTVYGEKIVGREKLKGYRKDGFFLYGNHTRTMGDAYCPNLLAFPKKAYIVASADCFSIKGIRRFVEDLGGIALPNDPKGFKNYSQAMKQHAEKGHIVALYPEAQISVHVAWGFRKQNTAVMIGKSIVNKASTVDIGELCLKYGGGGHRNAGTCQLENDVVDSQLPDIIAALNG